MKFSKTYKSFICYTTLLAFLSIISIEVSLHADYLHKKTEITSSKNNANTNINLVFEEENDTDELIGYAFLPHINFIYNALCSIHLIKFHENKFNHLQFKPSFLKNSLFLNYRVLRI